jgi:hypothetical protein
MKPQFRFFFKETIDKLYNERENIKKFVSRGLKTTTRRTTTSKKRAVHNKTQKRRRI